MNVHAQFLALRDTVVTGEVAADTIFIEGEVEFSANSHITSGDRLTVIQSDSSILSLRGTIQDTGVVSIRFEFPAGAGYSNTVWDLSEQQYFTVDTLTIAPYTKLGQLYVDTVTSVLSLVNGRYFKAGYIECIDVQNRHRVAGGNRDDYGVFAFSSFDSVIIDRANGIRSGGRGYGGCFLFKDVGYAALSNASFINVFSIDTALLASSVVYSGAGAVLATIRVKYLDLESIAVDSALSAGSIIQAWADTVNITNSVFTRCFNYPLVVTPATKVTILSNVNFISNFTEPIRYDGETVCFECVIVGNVQQPWNTRTVPQAPDRTPRPIVGARNPSITYANSYVAGTTYGDLPPLSPYPYPELFEGDLDIRVPIIGPASEWAVPAANSPLLDRGSDCDDLPDSDAFGRTRTIGQSCDLGAVERQQVVNVNNFDDEVDTIELWPNPASEFAQLALPPRVSSKSGTVTIRMYDSQGRLVAEHLLHHESQSIVRFSTNQLSAGLYNVVVAELDAMYTARLIIQ